MDIVAYIKPLIKWWWLILAAAVVAGLSSFIAASLQPAVYQSRTTLMVGKFITDPNPESGQIGTSYQLASIYADIANREPIQAATMDALGVDWIPIYNAKVLPNTQIIEITVLDIIPERAQIFADELARQLIFYTPTSTSVTGTNRQEFISSQLDLLQEQIIRTQGDLEELQQKLGDLNSAREIADTNAKITVFESKLYSLQSGYAGLLANTQEGASNTINLLEPANLPKTPVGPNKLLIILPAILVGAILASGAAYLLEFLNKSVESISDIKSELSLPILGEIPQLPNDKISWTYVDKDPISAYAEAFRRLRTNIEVSTREHPVQTILVSSAAEGDGKSTIAVNLAIAYSYLGKKVVILDADFRRHRINQVLELKNEPGLNELLSEELELADVIQHWKGNIFCIPSGKFYKNSTELLSSHKFTELIQQLEDIADFVIVDGPPFFLSETSSLSTIVDGLLIVIPIGITKDNIKQMKNQLEMVQSPILGVVANRVGGTSYYGYYYSSYNEDRIVSNTPDMASTKNGPLSGLRKLFSGIFSNKDGKDDFEAAEYNEEVIFEEELSPVDGKSNPGEMNVKTVPRIRNPKTILEKAILRSSTKSVEEDKEHLQDLARKKRKID